MFDGRKGCAVVWCQAAYEQQLPRQLHQPSWRHALQLYSMFVLLEYAGRVDSVADAVLQSFQIDKTCDGAVTLRIARSDDCEDMLKQPDRWLS
jgi:hypothetical protein